jgi:catechol 2,3-dioxygenase-like lactoylglutathione lyase family enzyme
MNDSAQHHVTRVATVFVPVADQDRALGFYVETLGWEQRGDFPYGDGLRWVEVAPSGSEIVIALVPSGEGGSPGGDATHCAIASDDIEGAHSFLRARGVDVDEHIAGKGQPRDLLLGAGGEVPDPVPRMFFFRDLDGNRFLVVDHS